MKLTTTTALAVVAALYTCPAIAQSKDAPQQAAQPGQPAQPKVVPSKGALKAIIDLQDAINKNDVANIPAKLAAANAVATTKEDKYLIGELHLKAGVVAKDSTAEVAAIDEIANSGYVDTAKSSQLYLSLGSTLYNNKQYPQAQAAFQKQPRSTHETVKRPRSSARRFLRRVKRPRQPLRSSVRFRPVPLAVKSPTRSS